MNQQVLEAKQNVVKEIVEKYKASATIVIAEYRGLTVAQLQEIRRALAKDNSELCVYKNSLVERAMDELGLAEVKDSLTGAKSKHAFVELENKIDVLISNRNIDSFSVVVFDINDLKLVNDTKGHEYGDIYIQDSYKIIKDVYQNTEIYRFGGDEFVGILDGIDYVNKDKLLEKFNAIIDKNISSGNPVVAAGMSNFNETKDTTFNSVFTRADEEMYNRKKHLKSLKS